MSQRRHSGDVGESLSLPASLPSKVETLDATIAGLADLDADQLRLQWRNHLGGTAPAHLPRWLLFRVLAYRLQAATLGDLDKATRRIIRASKGDGIDSAVGSPFAMRSPTTRDGIGLKAGALLLREWKGKLERVMALDKGFAWNGKTYGRLSQVAKAMTGTGWNGHRFFGLLPAREQRSGERAGGPNTVDESVQLVADRSKSAGRCGSKSVAGSESKRSIANLYRAEKINAESHVIAEGERRQDPAGVAP